MATAMDTYSDLELSDSDSDGESPELNKQFKAATEYVKVLVSRLDPDKLLQIYSFYKQATEGPCNIPRPKWYDMPSKRKWDAWNSLADLPSNKAKEKYINIVTELDPSWNEKFSDMSKSNSQHWITVSRPRNNPEDSTDEEKSIFDFCKDGNVLQVEKLLNSTPTVLNQLDSVGLGLIHWAADRGYPDMIKMLFQSECDVNLRDEVGQTALHYAVSCGHVECVKLLLECGIDITVKDDEGALAADLVSDDAIKVYF